MNGPSPTPGHAKQLVVFSNIHFIAEPQTKRDDPPRMVWNNQSKDNKKLFSKVLFSFLSSNGIKETMTSTFMYRGSLNVTYLQLEIISRFFFLIFLGIVVLFFPGKVFNFIQFIYEAI